VARLRTEDVFEVVSRAELEALRRDRVRLAKIEDALLVLQSAIAKA
jgi:hypothetical protein